MEGQDILINLIGGIATGDRRVFIDAALAASLSLATGAFFDWATKVGCFGFDLASKTATLIDDGTSVFTATTLSTIAKALIAIPDHVEEAKNQYDIMSSFKTSQRDILEQVEKVDGQEWTVKRLTSEEAIASRHRRLAAEISPESWF